MLGYKFYRSLLLCGAREQPAQLMSQADFERHVGAENICPSIAEALERAADVYQRYYSPSAIEQSKHGHNENLAAKN